MYILEESGKLKKNILSYFHNVVRFILFYKFLSKILYLFFEFLLYKDHILFFLFSEKY